jgi:hypothetical protein
MTLRWMYDASTPPANPPRWHVAAGYIGGNTPHVWTADEWADQPAPYRLPIFTASNRADDDAMARIDADLIRHELSALRVPPGCVVCVDIETRVYTRYLTELNALVRPWHLLVYGSLSTVRQNPQTSAGRWAADWTDNIFEGVDLAGHDRIVAVQWASADQRHLPYDSSVIVDSLPLWKA